MKLIKSLFDLDRWPEPVAAAATLVLCAALWGLVFIGWWY